jgi:hypothetical protein
MTRIFSFGFGHHMGPDQVSLANHYTVVSGKDRQEIFEKMAERRNMIWATDYATKEQAGVDRFNLIEIAFEDLLPQEGPTH